MEDLAVDLFGGVYRNKRVLLTGHTGFKGSWMSLWLKELGSEVIGYALPPETTPNHWDLLGLEIEEYRDDISNEKRLQEVLARTQPEIIFHFAAQALVRTSYVEPRMTWETNVMGTVNLLEGVRRTPSVQAVVIITTDKVYDATKEGLPYKESDKLGGHDPYSASKAACELVTESYRKSFFHSLNSPQIASARAGNVIGGGDFSPDRLIPDLVRSIKSAKSLQIRSPQATRPWQHVLDCLSGYLLLGQKLLMRNDRYTQAWNFGPTSLDNCKVSEVLEKLQKKLTARVEVDETLQPHETTTLALNIEKSCRELNWKPVWSLDSALHYTAEWYLNWMESADILSRYQLRSYVEEALGQGVVWAH